MRPVGDAVLIFGLWLWLTVVVGPWWVGVVLFAGAWVINHFTTKS